MDTFPEPLDKNVLKYTTGNIYNALHQLITKTGYPKFQNLIRPHLKTILPQTMKQM
jgi:hypothetical protein